jgi:CDP-glucose 4,6-dehydratase
LAGKRILVTGHTGFKGSWLCEWLLLLNAEVHGFALAPPTQPSLFVQLGHRERLASHREGDIRDRSAITSAIRLARPDFLFHLAAQSLVLASYSDPVGTFAANVMGTVHVLEALRALESPCASIIVTSDKCYENHEWEHAYRETDRLGGKDPYSSSKAMAELAVSSYRECFFRESPVTIASVRAGNVIGGGDWSENRIVPDAIRALSAGRPISVRNPGSTRPWQHVLEPLAGYLTLAERISEAANNAGLRASLSGAFNFGPNIKSNRTVKELVENILRLWSGEWRIAEGSIPHHEAGALNVAHDKAFRMLDWYPRWSFEETVGATVEWYRHPDAKRNDHSPSLAAMTKEQITRYCEAEA